MSDEFKPRKRRIDYKASKLFPQEMRIVARKGELKRTRQPIDPEVEKIHYELDELEFQLKKAEGRIKSGRVPELIPARISVH